MHRTGDILVVDDEIHIVDLIAEVLSEEGYNVRQAHDGASAMLQVSAGLPALILLDLSMPGMVGTTLLERLRADGMSNVPVVIMTAGSYTTEVLVAQGATDYLAKPFELDDLLACVSRYVPLNRSDAASTSR